jgi:hypothetical protein
MRGKNTMMLALVVLLILVGLLYWKGEDLWFSLVNRLEQVRVIPQNDFGRSLDARIEDELGGWR